MLIKLRPSKESQTACGFLWLIGFYFFLFSGPHALQYTMVQKKTCHLIFGNNSSNFWLIFHYFCTVVNRNEYSPKMYKIYNFALNVCPHYLVELKTTQKQPRAYFSSYVDSVVCKFYKKLLNVFLFLFFSSLLDNSFSNLNYGIIFFTSPQVFVILCVKDNI